MKAVSDYYAEQRFSDQSDAASAIEARFTRDALRGALARGRERIDPRFDGAHCVDCDADIPAARLALGKSRCIGCQEVVERQAGRFMR